MCNKGKNDKSGSIESVSVWRRESGDGVLELLTKFTNGNPSQWTKMIFIALNDVSSSTTGNRKSGSDL